MNAVVTSFNPLQILWNGEPVELSPTLEKRTVEYAPQTIIRRYFFIDDSTNEKYYVLQGMGSPISNTSGDSPNVFLYNNAGKLVNTTTRLVSEETKTSRTAPVRAVVNYVPSSLEQMISDREQRYAEEVRGNTMRGVSTLREFQKQNNL